jgi:type IV pilus assembly protein PilB
MNVLSATTQGHVEDALIKDGLINQADLDNLKEEAERTHQPIFSLLLAEGHITDEQLTKALAEASDVPYVNLTKSYIDPKVLALLPREIAENYMAVPLGEMQNRLVVAMLDADNVQAVDFLSNKINRPLKI